MAENLDALNKETREAWEGNAEVWDNHMGDGGKFSELPAVIVARMRLV